MIHPYIPLLRVALFRDNQGENVATIKMRKPMLRAWGGRA